MLPPPTTIATWTPATTTSFICSAMRSSVGLCIESAPAPANASPLSFSSPRWYFGWLPAPLLDTSSRLADVESREPSHLDVLAEDAYGRRDEVGDRLAVVAHVRLIEQHGFLVELLYPAAVLVLLRGDDVGRHVLPAHVLGPRGAD